MWVSRMKIEKKSNESFKLSPVFKAVSLGILGMSVIQGEARAASIQVNTNSDANVSACTLRKALASIENESAVSGCTAVGNFGVNDEITFANSINKTITLQQGGLYVYATSSLTIAASNIGGGVTINGNDQSVVFDIFNGDVTLDNLTITGGKNDSNGGGGIVSSDSLTLRNSIVTGNSGYNGGGIESRDELRIENSTISNNTARTDGAGIDSSFSTIIIVNSVVTNNSSGYSGGGLSSSGNVTIVDSVFSFNTVRDGFGGGIHIGGFESNLSISGSQILFNTANSGGGVYMVDDTTSNISNSEIMENTAANGGGIFLSNGDHIFEAITIKDNFANIQGGGINFYHERSGSLFASDSTLLINDSTISNNSASAGGGAYLERSTTFTVSNSYIENNLAYRGGAIFSTGGRSTLNYVTLSNNSAISLGGAVALENDSRFTLTSGTVSRNLSENGRGGGFWIRESSRANIVQSTLLANSAVYGGGIVAYSNGSAELINTTVTTNSATLGGGFLTFNSGKINLNHATVANNRAANAGGGFFAAAGGTVTLANSIIADSPTGDDCDFYNASITSDSASIIESGSCVTSARKVDPKLMTLANNGGPTLTHALLAGSPASNSGISASCPELDQRGEVRGISDGFCDVGAFELNLAAMSLGYLPAILKLLLLDEED